jgi:hypothetical protein
MDAHTFGRWLERQGRRVFRSESSWWHSAGLGALQAFPYHWTIHPPDHELQQVLRQARAVCLRYSAPVESSAGRLSYHVVRQGPAYSLEDLGKWARKNVRRGLRNCSVEPIGFDLLAEQGWVLQCETLDRQKRGLRVAAEDWQTRCRAANELPGFEAWGAFVGRQLAASVITFQMGDCVSMLYQQCRREMLSAHVNNALAFVVTQTMLGRPGVRSMFYSLHSLDAPPSMDEFKFRMGYAARQVRQRVVFHNRFAFLVNDATHALVRAARKIRPCNSTLAKAEGMMRFFLEGKRPLSEQITADSVPPKPLESLQPDQISSRAG